ncbi:hypothetical protein B0H13DRAFT_2657934 [Mycena leptocephala]|nr:hypothetical protein B0H13DRAFT_2657934 [Mycena leptocephala]
MAQPWPPMKKSASPAPSSSHRHSTCMHATHLSLSTVSRVVCNMRVPHPEPHTNASRRPWLRAAVLAHAGVAKTDIDVFEHRTCYGGITSWARGTLCVVLVGRPRAPSGTGGAPVVHLGLPSAGVAAIPDILFPSAARLHHLSIFRRSAERPHPMLALYSISIPDTLVFRSRKPNHPFTMECNLIAVALRRSTLVTLPDIPSLHRPCGPHCPCLHLRATMARCPRSESQRVYGHLPGMKPVLPVLSSSFHPRPPAKHRRADLDPSSI